MRCWITLFNNRSVRFFRGPGVYWSMRGRYLLVAALLVAAPFAGCIGEDSGQTTDNDELEQASVSNRTNGTIDTEALEGAVAFSAATPAVSFNFNPPMAGGPFLFELERPSAATGYVIEVTWEPTTPASENLDVWVRDANEGNIPPSDPTDPLPASPVATATGSSPLQLAIAEEDLEEDTPYNVIVRAPSDMGAGVAVNQPFTLHLSTFEDRPFNPDYSAVENGTAER